LPNLYKKMQAGIKITMIGADLDRVDEVSEFILQASNSSCSASQQFYLQRDGFKDFGKELKGFPANIESCIKLEWGGLDSPWANYLLLDIFCYEPTGKSAIKVRMETHFVEPHYDKSEFFIICYPAALNILGERLFNWNPLEESTFEWHA
jgi:hypothetical protein